MYVRALKRGLPAGLARTKQASEGGDVDVYI